MIEIALCLAIIGFALVSILLVLPSGMNTQRDTREATIIGQDASVLMEAIRGGAHGMDDLTNYVYLITNYVTEYDYQGKIVSAGTGYVTYNYGSAISDINSTVVSLPAMPITNGLRIIGLLGTPEYTDLSGQPITNLFSGGVSNHVFAYIRSFSGLAAEKPPQDNQIMQEDTFSYRLLCVNAPLSMAADTNMFNNTFSYLHQLDGNLHDLRLMYSWPVEPNGNVGGFRQTFRMSVAGQLVKTNYGNYFPGISDLYFYESGSFINSQ